MKNQEQQHEHHPDDDVSHDNTMIQYHYDQAVLLDGKQNLSLLLQCAKGSISLDSKFQHYKRILQINKYHIDANLWFAHYYQQHLMENNIDQQQQQQQQQKNRPRKNNTSTTLVYISYTACIVRAQFTVQKYITKNRRQQLTQSSSSNDYYQLKQQQCLQHRQYIQQQQATASSSQSGGINTTAMNSIQNINNMNHVNAAYIDVIKI